MKLSCLPVSFFSEIIDGRMSIGEWAKMGCELGLDAVDLSILFVRDQSETGLATVREQIESTGMSVAMITSYPDFTHPETSQRSKELESEIQVVEVARKLGAKMVRVTAGQAHPQTGREEGIDWAVEGLSCLTEHVKESGIQLVYENHAKPGVWQYTDFSQPSQIFLEIVRQTADCGLGINFDLGNAATFSEDPIALLELVVDRVISIHASDSSTRGDLNHTLLGTGITPYKDLFACLKRHGWDGWICMEEASNLGRTGVEQAASFIRKTWETA